MLHNSASGVITQISDLTLLEQALSRKERDLLMVFDIDNVLMMPADEYTLSRNPYRKKLWQGLKNRLPKEELEMLQSFVTVKAEWLLVDPKIAGIFAELKKNATPTVALTSFSTGKFGIIEKREELRIKNLHTLGFDFAELSPFKADRVIDELSGEDGAAMLKEGVIFTAELDKARVLEYVLVHENYTPGSIIFIDDQLNNLESVEKLCEKLGIKFHGFHYVAVSLLPPLTTDPKTEDLRFQILEKDRNWLINPFAKF